MVFESTGSFVVNSEEAFETDAVYQGDSVQSLYLVAVIVFRDLQLCLMG